MKKKNWFRCPNKKVIVIVAVMSLFGTSLQGHNGAMADELEEGQGNYQIGFEECFCETDEFYMNCICDELDMQNPDSETDQDPELEVDDEDESDDSSDEGELDDNSCKEELDDDSEDGSYGEDNLGDGKYPSPESPEEGDLNDGDGPSSENPEEGDLNGEDSSSSENPEEEDSNGGEDSFPDDSEETDEEDREINLPKPPPFDPDRCPCEKDKLFGDCKCDMDGTSGTEPEESDEGEADSGSDEEGDLSGGDNQSPENPEEGDLEGNIPEPPVTTPPSVVVPESTPDYISITPPSDTISLIQTRGVLNHSAPFTDIANRTRFDVDSQIEGLPPFITMEMVVGVLRAQDLYGFPASVAIAQIIQEGGYGAYGPGGEADLGLSRLSFQYNNLFGIKGMGPAGSVSLPTFEMTPEGEIYHTNYFFRVYNTYTESIMDRSQLLLEVYSDLTYGVTNANEFAWNIAGRWATDINYANHLIRHMETYDLYRLDEMTLYDYSLLIGEGRFIHPVPGSVITSTFGWREWDNAFHRGIDFGTGAYNLPIYAAYSGVVIFVGYGMGEGNWIVICHGDGLETVYMHNFANFVEVGQRVERGQQIALSGNTGNSTGNHLHFEVHMDGQPINPALMLGLENGF